MKEAVRLGVFETNSSSTHSVVIMSPEEWEDVKAGKKYVNITAHWYEDRPAPRDFKRYPEIMNQKQFDEACRREVAKHGHCGFSEEEFINPHSVCWEQHEDTELPDGRIRVEIDHFFG